MKLSLQGNKKEMYSAYNESKSVVAERFIRTLKSKIYKYMTSVSKMCILMCKWDNIINKYNSRHSTIKAKPADVKSTHIATLIRT